MCPYGVPIGALKQPNAPLRLKGASGLLNAPLGPISKSSALMGVRPLILDALSALRAFVGPLHTRVDVKPAASRCIVCIEKRSLIVHTWVAFLAVFGVVREFFGGRRIATEFRMKRPDV